MVLWPPNNFEIDSWETLSEQSHNQIFFPTTILEPNNFQQATGEELQEIIDAMTLNEDVSINDYIFWSSTRDGMFNDIRRVTLGTLLDMLEIEATAPTAGQIATVITWVSAKTTPVDADLFTLVDTEASNTLKKITWANIKATAKTYFDTLYALASHTHSQSDITGLVAALAAKQDSDADLTAIAAISPSDDDVIQRKAGAWINRTMAQLKADLALAKWDVGLGNVDNTSDSTKNSATVTLTNKRITPRITTITSSATPTINTDNCDAVIITALATAITSMTTNLSGTPTNFDKLIVRIKDDGTARAISWWASFEAKWVALPTTTVISKVLTVGFIYDTVTSKWGCVASAQEA